MKNKLQSSKPIRYIVNFPHDNDTDNFISYNCLIDNLNQSPYQSAYSFAINSACKYRGIVVAEYECVDPTDPNRYRIIKDYNK